MTSAGSVWPATAGEADSACPPSPPEEHAEIAQLPESFEAALESLREDHDYLTEGDVFTEDLIETWIDYKTEKEIAPLRQRPHPYEFALYYDI